MRYTDDNFIINCDESDKVYMVEVIAYLLDNYRNIMKYFNISKLNEVVEINIVASKKELDKLYVSNNDRKPELWLIGFARKNIINYLSLHDYKNTTHKFNDMDKAIEIYKRTLIHEFVHICHIQTMVTNKQLPYLMEGIAGCLSKQYVDKVDLNFTVTLDQIINPKQPVNYKDAYLLVDYIVHNYHHKYVLNLLTDFDFAIQETPRLYHEAKQYYIPNKNKRGC